MVTNGVVTLFRAGEKGGDFKSLGSFPAWVQRKQRLKNTNEGFYLCDDYDVRIPQPSLENVAPGDLIYFGRLAEKDFRVEKCRKVAAATENAYGGSPHWHLEAEVQYR